MRNEVFLDESLAMTIAGEIALSDNPGGTIHKWRNIFRIHQNQIAEKMNVTPSVISDYESGRRKSPGVVVIRKIVNALLEVDRKNGDVKKEFQSVGPNDILSDAIIDMQDYAEPIAIMDFLDIVKGTYATEPSGIEQKIRGYILVDSLNAVLKLSAQEMSRLHSLAQRRAVIFTGVSSGKSALVAAKVTNLKPCVIMFHGIPKLDPLAERIAKAENIPVILSRIKHIDEVILALKKISRARLNAFEPLSSATHHTAVVESY